MQIPEKIDSKFRFVLLAAHRAEQMVRGARPKLEGAARKPTRSAMAEILEDRVNWDYGPPPAPEAPPAEAPPAEES
jgi:DNA-directed RNA polymerase omega subunit